MYFLCLCIYASLSPEMNSLGTVHDRRRWRNRGSVYPSQQQTVKRVKSADGPNKRFPGIFLHGLEKPE